MSVISHITLGTNDKSRSKSFYDAALGAIGFKRLPKPAEKPLAYERNGQMPTIYIYTPEDGRPATWGNGTHVAFTADTRQQVDAFHAAALEDQVAKWIFGLRHTRSLASVDSEFAAEPLRLAKLFQIAQHEKKPPRNLDDIYRECC